MSAHTLTFVDHVGGELAAIAAAVARTRSVPARAHTTVEPTAISPDAQQVLREIGAPLAEAATPFVASNVDGDLIELGGTTLANCRAHLETKRYDGPQTTAFGDASLERLALLRIARDRIEAYLDLS